MSPKEKAKELFNKFLPHSNIWDCYNDEPLEENHALKCALIAVDEILRFPSQLMYEIVWYEFKEIDMNNWSDTDNVIVVRMNAFKYWQEVKQEIENYEFTNVH